MPAGGGAGDGPASVITPEDREALEYGFYYGRVVWFERYPFEERLELVPRTKPPAEPAAPEPPTPRGYAPSAPAGSASVRAPDARASAGGASIPSLDARMDTPVPEDVSTQPARVAIPPSSLPVPPRKRWSRSTSWRSRRLLADLVWYVRNHHFVLAPFCCHPLNPLGWGARLALLCSALGVAFAAQLAFATDVDAASAASLAELEGSEALSVQTYPELPTVVVASSLALCVLAGALATCLWERGCKLVTQPPCLHATLPYRAHAERAAARARAKRSVAAVAAKAIGKARSAVAAPSAQAAPRRAPYAATDGYGDDDDDVDFADDFAGGDGGSYGRSEPAADARGSGRSPADARAGIGGGGSGRTHERCAQWTVALCFTLGVGVGTAALLLSRQRVLLAWCALASVAQASLLSLALDALAFVRARADQLRRFGRLDVTRAYAYPRGLEYPSADALRASAWRYPFEPLADGPFGWRRAGSRAARGALARAASGRAEARGAQPLV